MMKVDKRALKVGQNLKSEMFLVFYNKNYLNSRLKTRKSV